MLRFQNPRSLGPVRCSVFVFSCLALLLLSSVAHAQGAGSATGTLEGRVVDESGAGVLGVELKLVDVRRVVTSGADGSFSFDSVPAGEHVLEAASTVAGGAVERVTVVAGQTTTVDVALELSHFRDSVVVSASGEAKSRLELAQATTVLGGDELSLRLEPSLGETLSKEPGISSTSFGAAASRPVIRGLGGDRVSMLENGLGTGDVSTTSPDHAVTVEPLAAESIEVLRGPATLLYGSNAVGGVVNVIDNRIPTYRSQQLLGGFIEMRGGTAANERTGAVNLDGGAGDWAWHVDGLRRETGNYDIPGYAEVDGAEHAAFGADEAFGFVPNSDLETTNGSVGVTRFFDDTGSLGISVTNIDSQYGLPVGHEPEGEGEDEGAEEENVRLDLTSRRVDLRGEITRPFGPFRGLKLRLGAVDYEHSELEGGVPGTTFFNDSLDGRLELVQAKRGSLSGSLGLQYESRDLKAVGEEAFLPPTRTDSLALFSFQEIEHGAMRYQFGLRYETQDVRVDSPTLPDRSFDAVSGSLGTVWQPREGYAVAVSLSRSVKLPNAEELYTDGLHPATQSFQVGDPTLNREVSTGLELGLRKQQGRLTGELSLFVNRFDDFIFEGLTGEQEESVPVVEFRQADVEFRGAELNLRYGLWETGQSHLDLEIFGDTVLAERRADDQPLPRIPPLRYGTGLHFHHGPLTATAEVRRVAKQDRVAENETPTDGFTMVNASFGYRLMLGDQLVDLLLRGTNLTDEEARNHVSFLKDSVPLPGRDIGISVRFWF